MARALDPIRLTPRFLPRRWGRADAPSWCAHAERPSGPIGEIWLAHPHNTTFNGDHFGARLAEHAGDALGELGRAPPSLRLIVTDEPSDPIAADAPVALWRVMESPLDAALHVYDRQDTAPRQVRARHGDLLRVSDPAHIVFPGGMTALEVRANFVPNNQPPRGVRRLWAFSEKKHRVAWLRDPAMSVELWTLPELSFIEPDGETCHTLTALTPGASIDGAALSRGDTVFVPAHGRRLTLTGRGAQLLVSYPDLLPTSVWKHGHAPKPAAMAVDPALLQGGMSFGGAPSALNLRAA